MSAKRIAFLSVRTILVWTIDIYNNILNSFGTLFKNGKHLAKRQEKGICLIFKTEIPHLAHRRAMRALIIASAERLKSLSVQAKFTRTLCIWTIHVPNENKSVIVIPTIKGEWATHRNCSQIIHTCLQRNICSCRDGEFRVG